MSFTTTGIQTQTEKDEAIKGIKTFWNKLESKEGNIQNPVIPKTLQLNNGGMFHTASSGSVYPEKQLPPFQSRLLLQNSWQLIWENSKHWVRQTECKLKDKSKQTSTQLKPASSLCWVSVICRPKRLKNSSKQLCVTRRMALMQLPPNLLVIRPLVRDGQLTDQHWRHGDAADVTQSVQTQAAHLRCCCTFASIAVHAQLHLNAPDCRQWTWRWLVRAACCSKSSCISWCIQTLS